MKLDLNSKIPIYMQISEIIREAVVAGDLKPNDSIPSVRQMCVEYGINPQTILNATSLLIQENILEKRRGVGMYVTSIAQEKLVSIELEKFRQEYIPFLVERGKLLGFTSNEICQIIKSIDKGDDNG